MTEPNDNRSPGECVVPRCVDETGFDDGGQIGRRTTLGIVGSTMVWLSGCSALQSGSSGSTEAPEEDEEPEETPQEETSAPTDSKQDSGQDDPFQGLGSPKEIVPGTAVGFPPFEIRNEDDEIDGFDIELLEAIVAETDYTLGEWENFDFKTLLPSLTSEKIDVIAAALTITEERKQTITFTDPYYSADQGILVREGGGVTLSSRDDLAGQTLGSQKGTTGEFVIQEEFENVDYRGYNNYLLAVQDLENQNLDAVLLDKPVAESFAANRHLEIAFIYETGEQYGFGIRDADDDLVAALNDGLQTVLEDGTYQELVSKWFGDE